jgi:hypothetical protein
MIFLKQIKFDELVKSRKTPFFVIPAPHQVRDKLQPESSFFQLVKKFLDSGLSALSSRPKGFHRSDDLLRNHRNWVYNYCNILNSL